MNVYEIRKLIARQVRLQEPKEYEWLGGKSAAKILKKSGGFLAEVYDQKENVVHKKHFSLSKYRGDSETAYKAAENWGMYYSQKCQIAPGSYVVIDDKYVVVRMSDDAVMLTDLRCLNICNLVDLDVSREFISDGPDDYLVYCNKNSINAPFHNLAVDKQDASYYTRFTMDNRLSNIRQTTESEVYASSDIWFYGS